MHSESITADGCSVFTLRFYISKCGNTKNICIGNITISGSVSTAPASTVELTWNETEQVWEFDMPEGNVEIEPLYYSTTGVDLAVSASGGKAQLMDGEYQPLGDAQVKERTISSCSWLSATMTMTSGRRSARATTRRTS